MSYPEHEKIDSAKIRVMDDLVEFLSSKGVFLAKWTEDSHGGEFMTSNGVNWRDLRVQYFGCDPAVLAREAEQMIEDLRKLNKK